MTDSTPAIRPRSRSSHDDVAAAAAIEATAAAGARDAATMLADLERRVVGQRRALAELSLLLAMHATSDGHRSPNAIVLGPTGVGKTHSLAVAAGLMGVPFVTTDATSLVPSGIVGEQVEDILGELVASAGAILGARRAAGRQGDDVALAEQGIVVVDEFDKLAAPEGGESWSQAAKRVIQRRLLKLAEGARLRVGVRRHDESSEERHIETGGILLIVSGAFSGLIGSARPGSSQAAREARRPSSVDLVAAGFLPELIGRLPVILDFEPLSPAELVGIVDHDDVSPLGVWRRYLDQAVHGDLVVDEAAKWIVAERASALGLGARGLAQVLFPVLARRARELVRSEARQTLLLRATDFMPEAVGIPVAVPLQ